jgi:response regulator RpfG family c-di-GMP phosphodiesterase
MPRTDALEYIRTQAGSHFDPELTKVFIQLVGMDV